jgi:hypothetical protein
MRAYVPALGQRILREEHQELASRARRQRIARAPVAELLGPDRLDLEARAAQERHATVARGGVDRDVLDPALDALAREHRQEPFEVVLPVARRQQDRDARGAHVGAELSGRPAAGKDLVSGRGALALSPWTLDNPRTGFPPGRNLPPWPRSSLAPRSTSC